MKKSDFHYDLPEALIAQTPIEPRDHSRMLVYDRADGSVRHEHFYDLPKYLKAGGFDLLNLVFSCLAGRGDADVGECTWHGS